MTAHRVRKTRIKIGSHVFEATVNTCTACGAYERDRELRNKMNGWGESLTSTFDTLQPRLSQTVHDYLEHRAKGFGLDKSGLIKAMYVFYLNHAVRHHEFKKIRELLQSHESSVNMEEGEKKKMPVRISYRAFRRLETYGLVWKCPSARAIEDAIKFCIGLEAANDRESNETLKELADKYKEVIEDIAMAA